MKTKKQIEVKLDELFTGLSKIDVVENKETWGEQVLISNCWILALRWVLKNEPRD
jgi:nitrogen fixation protein